MSISYDKLWKLLIDKKNDTTYSHFSVAKKMKVYYYIWH